jgi:hypothetical protein
VGTGRSSRPRTGPSAAPPVAALGSRRDPPPNPHIWRHCCPPPLRTTHSPPLGASFSPPTPASRYASTASRRSTECVTAVGLYVVPPANGSGTRQKDVSYLPLPSANLSLFLPLLLTHWHLLSSGCLRLVPVRPRPRFQRRQPLLLLLGLASLVCAAASSPGLEGDMPKRQ